MFCFYILALPTPICLLLRRLFLRLRHPTTAMPTPQIVILLVVAAIL
jgi:hypothetical protein